jgi:NAD(P)-dependent dehydrogenase (short-subunit alcohol dehydrogenase family)
MNGQSVVVTGAGRGIGLATCERLLQADVFVVGVEVRAELEASLRATLGERGEVVVGDVTDRAILARATAVAQAHGALRGWVNNAAINEDAIFHEITEDAYERIRRVDLDAYVWGCQEALRAFLASKTPGAIVNVSSVHGRVAFSRSPIYDIAKAGIDALTRYIGVEYGPLGIRCNGVAPGAVDTPLSREGASSAEELVARRATAASQPPLRRMAEAREIASVIAFLLSDGASYVNGETVAVDGALTSACMQFPLHPALVAASRGAAAG